MLQAHSLLWNYLWVAPQLYSLALAAFMWQRGLHRRFPAYFSYLIVNSAQELLLYGFDLAKSISPSLWWHVYRIGAIVVSFTRFAVINEILERVLHRWPTLARLGRNIITGVAVFLVLLAAVLAVFRDPGEINGFIYFTRVLQQSFYLVHAGLIFAIFVFAAYFHVTWQRIPFGIALGFAVLLCEHLVVSTISLTNIPYSRRPLLDMANMAAYHVAVLIWWYYIAVPGPNDGPSVATPGDPNLDVWNRELERFLQA